MNRDIIKILLSNREINKNKINSHQEEAPQLVWGLGSSLALPRDSKWSHFPSLGIDYSL